MPEVYSFLFEIYIRAAGLSSSQRGPSERQRHFALSSLTTSIDWWQTASLDETRQQNYFIRKISQITTGVIRTLSEFGFVFKRCIGLNHVVMDIYF